MRKSARRRVGFRHVALVTYNDTDPSQRAAAALGATGSGTHGMFFRVNGVALWARGANVVPMEQLEGRLDGTAHRALVASAVAGRMNMLRVWGGGTCAPLATARPPLSPRPTCTSRQMRPTSCAMRATRRASCSSMTS